MDELWNKINAVSIKKFQRNKAILLSVLSTGTIGFSGLISTVFAANYLDGNQLGYYYTFISLASIKVLADLGLNVVVISAISHKTSSITFLDGGKIKGKINEINFIINLSRFAIKWYFLAGIFSSLLIFHIGKILFESKEIFEIISWSTPWLCFSIIIGINLAISPIYSILEGCNQTHFVYQIKIYSATISIVLAYISFANGADLMTCSILMGAEIIFGVIAVIFSYKNFYWKIFITINRKKDIKWKENILPMQWRIAISWISGYLTFHLFVPLIFHFDNPITAGKMGISLAIVNGITSIAVSLIAPQFPRMGKLISTNNSENINNLFIKNLRLIILYSIISALTILFLIWNTDSINQEIKHKIIKPNELTILLIPVYLQILSLPFSSYLRAHKKEPLYFVSLLSGIFTLLAIFYGVREYSTLGVVIGYSIVSFIQFPIVIYIWFINKKKWYPI